MRNAENYLIQYAQFWTYCNLRCQNKLTSCCATVDFENEIATGCGSSCQTSCQFYEYHRYCEDSGHTVCTVNRRPYKNTIKEFQLTESFCLPEVCNTESDLNGIMEHYSTAGKFPDAIGNYQDLKVVCEGSVALTILYVLVASF